MPRDALGDEGEGRLTIIGLSLGLWFTVLRLAGILDWSWPWIILPFWVAAWFAMRPTHVPSNDRMSP